MKKSLSIPLVMLFVFAIASCKKEVNPMQPGAQKEVLQTTPLSGNIWTQLPTPVISVPGPIPTNMVNFSFGANDKLYAALPGYNQLWQYDLATAKWTLKQYPFFNFTIYQTGFFHYAFTNGNDVYFLNTSTKSLKQYNLLTAQWADRASFPGTASSGVAAAYTATKGYILSGANGSDNTGVAYTVAENWEYDFAGNAWALKANTPGSPRYNAAAFSVGDKIYFGTGVSISVFYNPISHKLYRTNLINSDWWEYNSTLNSWSQKSAFGGGAREDTRGFVIDGKVYLGMGAAGFYIDQRSDLWCYDPATNVWRQRSSYPPGAQYPPWFSTVGAAGHGFAITEDITAFWSYIPLSTIITPGMNGTVKPLSGF